METRTGTSSTILFGFAPTRITDEHVAVVFDQSLAQFVLGLLIHVLGVVGHDTLGNGGADGVNLGGDTSSLDADADVEVAELFLSANEDGFKDLEAHGSGLDEFDGLAIDLDQTAALLGKGHCGGILLSVSNKERVC